MSQIRLTWELPENAWGSFVARIEIQMRHNGGPWTSLPSLKRNAQETAFDIFSDGRYECRIRGVNLAGKPGEWSEAKTVTAARPTFILQPQGGEFEDGSIVTLSASVTGFPAPTIRWYKDGQALASTQSVYQFTLSSQTAGVYYAKATNIFGVETSEEAQIAILPQAGDPNTILLIQSTDAGIAVSGFESTQTNLPSTTTTDAVFGSSSIYLQSGYGSTTVNFNDEVKLDGDFTVEFFVNQEKVYWGGSTIILSISNDYSVELYLSYNSIYLGDTSTWNWRYLGTFDGSSWCHVAIVRSGNTIRSYVNGHLTVTDTLDLDLTCQNFEVMRNGAAVDCLIEEFRVSNIARYSGTDFSPPTAPF